MIIPMYAIFRRTLPNHPVDHHQSHAWSDWECVQVVKLEKLPALKTMYQMAYDELAGHSYSMASISKGGSYIHLHFDLSGDIQFEITEIGVNLP